MLTSVVEANGEASEEDFAAVKSALDNCGITAQAEAVDLPRSLAFVEEAVKGLSPPIEPQPPVVHEGPCAYQVVDGQPGSLACTLGCANMLHFANTTMAQEDSSFAQSSQQGQNQQARLTQPSSGLVTYTGNNAYQVVESSPVVRQLQPQLLQPQQQLQSQQLHHLQAQQQQFIPVYVGGQAGSSASVGNLPMPVTTQAGRGRGKIILGK
jgi:hypothetical protein